MCWLYMEMPPSDLYPRSSTPASIISNFGRIDEMIDLVSFVQVVTAAGVAQRPIDGNFHWGFWH